EEKSMDVTVVSGDKDMFQLISPRVRIFDSMKNKTFGEPEVLERFGVSPSQVIEIMGLMGDKIDNVPGVPGVGEKTAVTLIKRFGSIENLISRAGEIEKPKLRNTIQQNADQARLSLSLVTIDRHCPVELNLKKLRLSEPDKGALTALLREMEFNSLLRQFEPAESPGDTTMVSLIDSEKEAKTFISWCVNQKKVSLSFELFSAGPEGGPGTGVGLASGDKTAFIRLTNPEEDPQEVIIKRLAWFKPVLENSKILKVVHDLKSAMKLCRGYGLQWTGPASDTMIMSYLLNPNRRDHSLEAEALSTFGVRIPEIPKKMTGEESPDLLAQIIGKRTAFLFELDKRLNSAINEQNLKTLYQETELPLSEVLADMELSGIKLDVGILNSLLKEVEGQMEGMTKKIHSLAGTSFNLNSPKQLSDILFNRLGLKPIKRTKTGFSTNEEVLQQLAVHHELPAEILGYRQLSK
ncbi:MAG TPA: DNA polymerase, partial [Nitrospiria bacterium]|nr:DNA polymerase [Nitrospiria bacterium]